MNKEEKDKLLKELAQTCLYDYRHVLPPGNPNACKLRNINQQCEKIMMAFEEDFQEGDFSAVIEAARILTVNNFYPTSELFMIRAVTRWERLSTARAFREWMGDNLERLESDWAKADEPLPEPGDDKPKTKGDALAEFCEKQGIRVQEVSLPAADFRDLLGVIVVKSV